MTTHHLAANVSKPEDLELVLDVYDDGTIQLVSTSDDRLTIGRSYSSNDCVDFSQQQRKSIEPFCDPVQPTSLALQHSDDDDSSNDEEGPELVELCPCRCENCHADCFGSKGRSKGDEMVMVEANVVIKIPIKRKNVERLLQLSRNGAW